MLSKLLSLVHGGKKEEPEVTAEKTEMPKPSKDAIMNVVGRFKLSAFDGIDVLPKDEKTIEYLKSLGLVTVIEEHFLNASTGTIEYRKTAKWNSWRCEDCVHFFVGEMKTKPSLVADEVTLKNIRQCKRGFSLQFTDTRKGKRCAFFEDKRLKGALDGSVN